MSLAEIAHRVEEQAKRAADRRLDGGWSEFPVSGAEWPSMPGLEQSLRSGCSPGLRAAIAVSAEALLAGGYEALGVRWPDQDPADLYPAPLWRLDPVTGGLWPGADVASADVSYRHQTRLGSIKYVWEINRLQFLQTLAAHFALTADERALQAVGRCIDSWRAANPPFRGCNWNSGIELVARAVSLIVVMSLCGAALGQEDRQKVRQILAASLYWLARYPSRHSSANNHRVAEALGLFMIGSLCPELAGAEAAAEEGREILESEAQLQILPDGIGAEQSPTYAALTVEALLTAGWLGRGLGRPFSGAYDQRLGRFGEAIAWFVLPDGRAPAIGDDDEGVVWATADHGAYPASVAAAVAGYLRRPGFCPAGPRPELRDAIFGAPAPAAASPAVGVKTFAKGGYTVVRGRAGRRDIHLVLDHGPLGYLSIAAHGHADANAILLAVDGAPVLIDPGTYMYHAQDDWRSWFRGTRAHNTVCVAGADQSQIIGPFMWGRKAIARLEEAADGPDWRLKASHDGYRRRSGVVHERTVAAAADGIVVVDRLRPARATPVEVVFQFAPELDVRRTGDGAEALTKLGWALKLAFDEPGAVTLASGGKGYDQGWVSRGFGRKEPAPRLTWSGLVPAAGLRTHIRLTD